MDPARLLAGRRSPRRPHVAGEHVEEAAAGLIKFARSLAWVCEKPKQNIAMIVVLSNNKLDAFYPHAGWAFIGSDSACLILFDSA